jgi:hypothetical protein
VVCVGPVIRWVLVLVRAGPVTRWVLVLVRISPVIRWVAVVFGSPGLASRGIGDVPPRYQVVFSGRDEFSEGQERPEQDSALPRLIETGTMFSLFWEDSSLNIYLRLGTKGYA